MHLKIQNKKIKIYNKEFDIVPNTLLMIFPWEIVEITQVEKPLAMMKISYNSVFNNFILNSLNRYKKSKNNILYLIKKIPVVYFNKIEAKTIKNMHTSSSVLLHYHKIDTQYIHQEDHSKSVSRFFSLKAYVRKMEIWNSQKRSPPLLYYMRELPYPWQKLHPTPMKPSRSCNTKSTQWVLFFCENKNYFKDAGISVF